MDVFRQYVSTPAGHALLLAIAAVGAGQGWLALWAARSRLHWFWRAAALFGGVLVFLPSRAYEPAMLAAIMLPLAAGAVRAVDWLNERWPAARQAAEASLGAIHVHFRLGDVACVVVLAALGIYAFQRSGGIAADGAWRERLVLISIAAALLGVAGAIALRREASAARIARIQLPVGWSENMLLLVLLALLATGIQSIDSRPWPAWGPMVGPALLITAAVILAYAMVLSRGRLLSVWLLAMLRLLRPADVSSSIGPRSGPVLRFSLRDLFLLVLFVALVISLLRPFALHFSWREWQCFLLGGAFVAASVAGVYGSCRFRRWMAMVLLVAIIVCGASFVLPPTAARASQPLLAPFLALESSQSPHSPIDVVALVGLTLGEMCLLLALLIVPKSLRRMALFRRLPARAALGGALSCGLLWLYVQMIGRTPMPELEPSGEDQYRRIIDRLRAFEPYQPIRINGKQRWHYPPHVVAQERRKLLAELPALLDPNASIAWPRAADLTREAAERQRHDTWQFYRLTRDISGEAATASMIGDFDAVTSYWIINHRLFTLLHRGGTTDEAFNASYCEYNDYKSLVRWREDFSRDSLRRLLAALQRSLAIRENPKTIETRDQAIAERTDGWSARFRGVFRRLAQLAWRDDVWRYNYDRSQLLARLLQADFAIRLFDFDHDRPPKSLDELVPDYLEAIPTDPLSNRGQPLVYRIEAGRYVLYSVGPDSADNGGQFSNEWKFYSRTPGYDCDLETWTRPR